MNQNDIVSKTLKVVSNNKSFLIEAGAGGGKTTALVDTINAFIKNFGEKLYDCKQKIACITYTKRAVENIKNRIEDHPLVVVSTSHAFFWEVIAPFQQALKEEIICSEAWQKRWKEKYKDQEIITDWVIDEFKNYQVIYKDTPTRIIDSNNKVLILHHDDILSFTGKLLESVKFRKILVSNYPYILIDEYQDVEAEFAWVILKYLEGNQNLMPIIGFYGDPWQTIYSNGIGEIHSKAIEGLQKRENYRSSIKIVCSLNKMRETLQQIPQRKKIGQVKIYHTNKSSNRRTESHWKGDLVEEEAIQAINNVKSELGWDFEEKNSDTGKLCNKVLYLTHKLISRDNNYQALLESFPKNDVLLESKNPIISFLLNTVEPIYQAFTDKNYAEILKLNKNKFLESHEDKRLWADFFCSLDNLRKNQTIEKLLEFLLDQSKIIVPDNVKDIFNQSHLDVEIAETVGKRIEEYQKFSTVSYQELINFSKFINEDTALSTQHGVKGEEYPNVLVILGRGWNNYNWNDFLEWSKGSIPNGKDGAYIRNRNLFYVSCSRAKNNLVLLFTQKLSEKSLEQLNLWFGSENIELINI